MSARRLLRDALPPVLRESAGTPGTPALIERWLEACEQVLDPVQALLDNLPSHLDPALASGDLLDLLGRWLGLDWPVVLPESARRDFLHNAVWLTKWRGTQWGLERAFELACPQLELEVSHSGAVTTSADPPDELPVAEPLLEVRSRGHLSPDERALLTWLIEDQRPAHVHYRLIEGPGAVS